jgi:hypothetical protein
LKRCPGSLVDRAAQNTRALETIDGAKRDDFMEKVEHERPDVITAGEVTTVTPQPWFDRRGSGQRARIRMELGEVKYERRPGVDVWRRVDDWTVW